MSWCEFDHHSLVIDHPLHPSGFIFLHWDALYPHVGHDLASVTLVEASTWWVGTIAHMFMLMEIFYWFFHELFTLLDHNCHIICCFSVGRPLLHHMWGFEPSLWHTYSCMEVTWNTWYIDLFWRRYRIGYYIIIWLHGLFTLSYPHVIPLAEINFLIGYYFYCWESIWHWWHLS